MPNLVSRSSLKHLSSLHIHEQISVGKEILRDDKVENAVPIRGPRN
jgi:hypothetical protein